MQTDVVNAERVVTRSPSGIPPYRLRFTYGAILSLQDADEILTRMRIAATPAPSALRCEVGSDDRNSAGQVKPSTLQVVAQ